MAKNYGHDGYQVLSTNNYTEHCSVLEEAAVTEKNEACIGKAGQQTEGNKSHSNNNGRVFMLCIQQLRGY